MRCPRLRSLLLPVALAPAVHSLTRVTALLPPSSLRGWRRSEGRSEGRSPSLPSSTRLSSSSSSSSSPSRLALTAPPFLPAQDVATKRLFLVRHGEVINPGGDRPVFYGALDVPLSILGQQEAQAAAAYLQSFPLAAVYASPLQRAIYGAQQIAAAQATADVTILAGFKELDRGAWAGQTKDEIGQENLASFDACNESITPEGGESYPALKARVLEALSQALAQLPPGEAAAIVSHLQVTRSILSQALGVPTEEMTQLPVATASITCIDYYEADHAPAIVHFQSFKPDAGLEKAKDGAN